MTDETNPKLNGFLEAARGLSRNPLGIIGLFQALVYAIAGLVATFGNSFTPFQRDALTVFLVGFPLVILGVFGWLVSRHSGKLFAPSDYRDDANYLQAVQAAAVTGKLQSGPAEPPVQLAIASAEVKTLPSVDTAETEAEVSPKDELLKPQADWKRSDYAWAYLCAIRDDPPNAEVISDAYLRTEQASEGDNAYTWKALCLSLWVRFANKGNLDNFELLKQLGESKPLVVGVQEQLALGYMHYSDFEGAASGTTQT